MNRTISFFLIFFFLFFFTSTGFSLNQSSSTISWQDYNNLSTHAKSQHRLILLFGKAEWCQACQKMETITFRDPAIVSLIQNHYVPVSVDIDKNIDIARQYKIIALPTVIILDENYSIIKIFTGYINPEELAKNLNEFVKSNKPFPVQKLAEIKNPGSNTSEKSILSKELRVKLEAKQLALFELSKSHGWDGIGDKKYLNRSTIEYGMTLAAQGNQLAEEWAHETLESQYGLLDPIWGGMYLYSSHGDWMHPNFEKTALSQAEDMRLYSQAYVYWQNPSFLLCAQKIAEYIDNFLTSPQGEFYTGQDAYLVLGKQDPIYYQLDDQHRRELGIPKIDKNIYPKENGAVINAFTYMFMITGNRYYLQKAITAANSIIKNFGLPDGGFRHTIQNNEKLYLADTLVMSIGFLTLYKATTDYQYLMLSEKAIDFINKHFQNQTGSPGFVSFVDKKHPSKSTLDADENAVVVRITALLYHYTGNKTYKEMASKAMEYLVTPEVINKQYPALVLMANMRVTKEPLTIIIVGSKKDELAQQLYATSLQYPSFYARLEWWDKKERTLPNINVTFPSLSKSSAFICINNHCSLPIFDPHHLIKIIRDLNISSTMNKQFIYEKPIVAPPDIERKSIEMLKNSNWVLTILGFWVLGLLLSFTPCVLPLVLILISLIASQNVSVKRFKIFKLSITYVLTIALSYSILGIAAASFGFYIHIYLQKPWVILIFCLFLLLLAGSLLGFYTLHLPIKLQRYLIKYNKATISTTYVGVALMGLVVTLIATPCAAAPVLGVLTYIAETGNIFFGAITLFAMGIGVGTPLLFVTTFGSTLIAKVEAWGESIKKFFGLLLLGGAIWLISRIISGLWTMVLWSAFVILTAIYMDALSKEVKNDTDKFLKMSTFMVLMYGIALFIGALIDNTNPFQPLELKQIFSNKNVSTTISFQQINNLTELKKSLKFAQAYHKPVLLDFYASWCAGCKTMEIYVFGDPKVQNLLSNFVLLRVDLSSVSPEGIEVAKYFKVIAPPATLFFDKTGKQINIRVNDNIDANGFAQILQQILAPPKNKPSLLMPT